MFSFHKKNTAIDEIDKDFNELRKIITKSDNISRTKSVDIIKRLAELDLAKFSELILARIKKHDNKFIKGLTTAILSIRTEVFSVALITTIIDYSFKYGDAELSRNAALILISTDYKSHDTLISRYKLVFVKDKKTQDILNNIYGN